MGLNQHFLSNFKNLQPRIVLNLFLGFGQISASCSYKIVLIKKSVYLIWRNSKNFCPTIFYQEIWVAEQMYAFRPCTASILRPYTKTKIICSSTGPERPWFFQKRRNNIEFPRYLDLYSSFWEITHFFIRVVVFHFNVNIPNFFRKNLPKIIIRHS